VHGGQSTERRDGLDRYRLLRPLGEGGMAIVHLAYDERLGRKVAVKELKFTGDQVLANRFVHESRLIGSLTDAHIVSVFDYFQDGGVPFIVMEYLQGGSLRDRVGTLTLEQLGGALEDVLAGLARAEERGIVHRDVKPENLLVSDTGTIKIADFGIAKVTNDLAPSVQLTAPGLTVGTPMYMAPEQAQGGDVGPWSDLYAVGCVAYELYTGSPPFPLLTDPLQLVLAHINAVIPPAHELTSNAAPAMSDWIDRLLVKDPRRRIPTAAAAWAELEDVLESECGPRWRRRAALPELDMPARTVAVSHSVLVDPSAVVAYANHEAPVARPPVITPEELRADRYDDTPSVPTSPPLRPQPSAPETQARSRRPLVALVVAAGVLVVALAVVVFPGDDEPGEAAKAPAATPSAAPSTLSAGRLSVQVPAGWTPRAADGLDAFALDGATAAGPAEGGTVLLGMAPADSTTAALLPPDLAAVAPEPIVERLASGVGAYRYDGLQTGSGRGVVYAVPTSAGVATVVCRMAEPADPEFATACEGVAHSLAVRDARVFTPGPNAAYARTVGKVVRAVNGAQRPALRRLRDARTPGAQARAVTGVHTRIERAARPLRTLEPSPADRAPNAALAKAFGTLADSYAALRGAAERSRGQAYNTARSRVTRSRRAANAALDNLRDAGYDNLPAVEAPAVARLRPRPTPTPAPSVAPAPTVVSRPAPTATYVAPQPRRTPVPEFGDTIWVKPR
jgi:serine/threonine protein kinase